jgi:hypothetical protein
MRLRRTVRLALPDPVKAVVILDVYPLYERVMEVPE